MDFEIVGLYKETHGRSCTAHRCCGKALQLNDLVRIKYMHITVSGKVYSAAKVVQIIQGEEGCIVGFLPAALSQRSDMDAYHGRFAQVVDLYVDSPESTDRQRDQELNGVAACTFLSNVDEVE
mmetsp:Transcript_50/g.135  ORF Transcript_50/g.135 Transcript_50/m.135 type:complete len:123 (+) Transcript_50:51-419(+)